MHENEEEESKEKAVGGGKEEKRTGEQVKGRGLNPDQSRAPIQKWTPPASWAELLLTIPGPTFIADDSLPLLQFQFPPTMMMMIIIIIPSLPSLSL